MLQACVRSKALRCKLCAKSKAEDKAMGWNDIKTKEQVKEEKKRIKRLIEAWWECGDWPDNMM